MVKTRTIRVSTSAKEKLNAERKRITKMLGEQPSFPSVFDALLRETDELRQRIKKKR